MKRLLSDLVRAVSLLVLGLIANPAWADVVTYFHNDIAGTPMAATDQSGNLVWKESYRPYGERLRNQAGPDDNRLWFGGKSQDPDTGLSYLGARYYNPQLGRFTGIDPKEVDPEDPHRFNRYAYGNNNPYKYIDPNGGVAFLVVLAAAFTTATITDHAISAYNQNTSIFDRGINKGGIEAAAASVATDTAIAAGAAAAGGVLGVLVSKAPINIAAKTAVPDGKFYSTAFETTLSPTSYPGVSRYMHFKEANVALDAALQSNPALAKLGISVPKSPTGSILGKPPENWAWHHDTKAGVMQLVPKSQHPNIPGGIFWETMHPGGNGGFSIWGK